MKKKSAASVVLYALMMISVIVILTHQLVRGIFVGSQFIHTMVERERAEMLALSGVTLAMAQLTYDEKEDKKEEKAKETEKDGAQKKGYKGFLTRILPHLNRWQEFTLSEKVDGIDGLIRTCIMCESGKININEAFDFKKMEFKREFKNRLEKLELRGRIPAGELLNRLTEFFKKKRRKLDDISELHAIPGLDTLDIFYHPPRVPVKGKQAEPAELALQDFFTIWTADDKIDPLFLSNALCTMIGVRRPLADDAVRHKERFAQFIQSFNKEMMRDCDAHWKVFENIYDQKPKDLAEIKNLFTKEFGPKIFSVLSCGKVGHVEQTVLAVIQKEVAEKAAEDKPKESKEEKGGKDASQQEAKKTFRLLRVYWL